MAKTDRTLARLRRICLPLPDTKETITALVASAGGNLHETWTREDENGEVWA